MRDYTEISKWLRNCADINGGCTTCPMIGKTCCVMTLQGNAADAIEELLVKVPHWISVEDELPHYLDHVLCVNKYGIQMVGHLTDYKEGGFRCESGMDSCDYITYWMPLPEPPKGVE